MKMLAAALATFPLIGSAGAAIVLTAATEYDAATNANVVDGSATSLTLATFKTDLAAAVLAGTGGVVTFDGLASPTANNNGNWTITYGNSQTLNVTPSSTLMRVQMDAVSGIAATPISGNSYYRLTGTGANLLTFSAGSYLSEFGLTILARNNERGLDNIRVTFTDGTTATVIGSTALAANTANGISNYIDSPESGPDLFFGYVAPDGKAIQSISIDASDLNGGNLVIDDFGFIVSPIPEPSAAFLATAGIFGCLVRRRRNP